MTKSGKTKIHPVPVHPLFRRRGGQTGNRNAARAIPTLSPCQVEQAVRDFKRRARTLMRLAQMQQAAAMEASRTNGPSLSWPGPHPEHVEG